MKTKSAQLYESAQQYIPGGVNSPVRAFRSVGLDPVYIERGEGPYLFDVDGKKYIDYVCSWGPLVLGHADPRILDVVREQAVKGTSFGANTEIEVEFAKLITEIYPSIDQVRMVNSGTEATMSAVRLARGFTGKHRIIKFEGCYHGHGDSFLIKAGSGVLTLGIPGSPGITEGTAGDTLIAEFNNLKSVEELLDTHSNEVAAVILEPVMANASLIPPKEDFLKGLRELTRSRNVLLIFDEVITGFRLGLGGAQEKYGITPDLTTLGKIIGGGFPVGAFGGREDIMAHLAPDGPVYQAGTLSGNPLALHAGFETVRILKEENPYAALEKMAAALDTGIGENLNKLGLPYTSNRVGSMLCFFFTDQKVDSYTKAMTCDTDMYARYFSSMLNKGVYLAPSQFEVSFVSTAHSEKEIETTIAANYESLRELTS